MTTERRPPKKELTPEQAGRLTSLFMTPGMEAFAKYLSQYMYNNLANQPVPPDIEQFAKSHAGLGLDDVVTQREVIARLATRSQQPNMVSAHDPWAGAMRFPALGTAHNTEPIPVTDTSVPAGASTAGVEGLAASEAEAVSLAGSSGSAAGVASSIATTPLSMEGLTPDTINQKISTQLQLLNSPELAKSISDAVAKEKATGKVIPENLIQAANLLKQSDETQRETLTKAAIAQAVQQWAISNLELDPTSLTRIATDIRTGIPVYQSINANSPMDNTIKDIVDDIYGQYTSSPVEGRELTRLSIPKSLEAPMFNDAFNTMVGSGKSYTQALKVMTRASPEAQPDIWGKLISTAGHPFSVQQSLSNPTNLTNFQQLLNQLITDSSIKATEMSEQYKQKGWNIPGSYFNMQDYALGMAAPPAFTKFFGEIGKLPVNQMVPGTFAHLTDLVPGSVPSNFGSIVGLGGFGPVGGGSTARRKRPPEEDEDEELMWQQLTGRVLGQQPQLPKQPSQTSKPRKTTSL